MSHTSTISSILISDTAALRATVAELKSKGVRCDLLENAIPRSYSSMQEGMNTKAPFVVKLHDAQFDVGLYESNDGKGLEARTDFWNGSVERQLGVKPGEGDDAEQAKMGKLYQTYAVQAATRKAVQQGYRVNRVNKQDGGVQLQIAV